LHPLEIEDTERKRNKGEEDSTDPISKEVKNGMCLVSNSFMVKRRIGKVMKKDIAER